MPDWRDRVHVLRETVEERVGLTVQTRERVHALEEAWRDRRLLARELQDLAYTALAYRGADKRELKPEERRKLVEKGWIVWRKDAMAGAAIDLMNEFVWGRGMVKPKATDPQVQKVIDDFWADPDNEDILTGFDAQLALGVDLEVQCNVFILVFDDGDDGKVKLGILEHDSVERPVRWGEKRQRVLYYLAYEFEDEYDWDYATDRPAITAGQQPAKQARYYAHWRNVEISDEEAETLGVAPPAKPPANKLGQGKVFHLRLNRGTEMVFGHPRIDRLIRWYSAYNRFLEDRLDVMHAKAAFVMQRQVKGSPTQLDKMASRSLSVLGELGGGPAGPGRQIGPEGAGNVLNTNEQVDWKELSLDTGSAAAEGDGRMIRSPISAVTGFPPTYFGDMSSGTLATATSLELPVLKAVETRQEFWEQLVRFSIDRAIERAVDTGIISEQLTPEEIAAKRKREGTPAGPPGPNDQEQGPAGSAGEFGPPGAPTTLAASSGYEDQSDDEEATQRDLSYEFSMPNPLRRMLTDIVTACQTIATTFDPNNTNPELSRVLLTVALGEGLELDSVPEIVERIFPPGYKDPALVAAAGPPTGFGEFDPTGQGGAPAPGSTGSTGADGQRHGAANPYGAPMRSPQPGEAGALTEAARTGVVRGRAGQPVRVRDSLDTILGRHGIAVHADGSVTLDGAVLEGRYEDLPHDVRARHRARLDAIEGDFEGELARVAGVNGNGNGNDRG